MAGDLNTSHEKLIRTMLILDSVRGEDSTGIVTIGKYDPKPKMAKQVGDPFQLFDHKSYDRVFAGFQRAIIGHNRYATTGAVNRNNAHPFENEGVVGAHNGTLNTKHLLADAPKFTVDSENIFHHIDKFGVRDALKYMGGAWALVWWDKQEKTINFLRNEQRPLYVTYSKDGKVMFWASESWMLYAALNKHNIAYDTIEILPVDLHVSIEIDDKGVMGKPTARAEPSTYVPPATPYINSGWLPGNSNPGINTQKKEEPSVVPPKKLEGVINGCETFYLSAKNRRLETLNEAKDQHGSSYIACFDPMRPYFDVRIYAKPDSPLWDTIGCEVYGDVSGFNSGGVTPGRGYYKITPHNVRVIAPTTTVATPIVKEEEEEPSLMGPSGKWITKSQFEKDYAACDYCSVSLIFGDVNRFTTGGQCVCPTCAKDSEVLKYVNLH
jgi:hypothetical protein